MATTQCLHMAMFMFTQINWFFPELYPFFARFTGFWKEQVQTVIFCDFSIMVGAKQHCLELRKKLCLEFEAGSSYGALSSKYDIPRSTVSSIVKKYKETGIFANLPKSGRKPILSPVDVRNVIRTMTKDPTKTKTDLLEQIERVGKKVSKTTLKRVLNRHGLYARRPRKTPLHKKRHLEARLAFAKNHLEQDDAFWDQVLWTDETKIELFGHNDQRHVWR